MIYDHLELSTNTNTYVLLAIDYCLNLISIIVIILVMIFVKIFGNVIFTRPWKPFKNKYNIKLYFKIVI